MPFITWAMHGRKAATPCRLKLNNHPMGGCSMFNSTYVACELVKGRREELTHYEIKHCAWTVPKEDGSTSLVLGSALQTFPFAPWNLEDRQPKLKVSVMVHISPAHHCMHEASVLILLVVYYMATPTDTLKDTRLCINTPGPLPHQHCCARGRPHTVDLPPHQRGREQEGRDQRRRGR